MPTNTRDFGKAVLQDQRTGDLYVDKDGNPITVEDISLALQECLAALKTIIGEELFDMDWGLDFIAAVQNPFRVPVTTLLTSLVKQCLDPAKIPYITDANVTRVQADPDDENLYYMDVVITTLNGNHITLTTDLGE